MNEVKYPNKEFQNKIENIPTKPGIYQYFNDTGKVIYVGKAKNLRNRVRSYFQQGRILDAKTKAMITHINSLEYIVVDSETEALLLEDTLIKKLKPKYNVLLRDDKTFPYITVTNEEFPRIFPSRKVIKNGSKYFGPYTDVRNMKQVMKLIRTLFMVRSCELNLNVTQINAGKFKSCLDYHIQKCEGPCVGYILREEYNNNISKAIQILNGKSKDLEKQFEEEMIRYSDELKFEKANLMKNRLLALKEYNSKQKIISADLADRDIFGLAVVDDYACSLVLKIRDGKLVGKRHFIIKNADKLNSNEIIERTIQQWYIESEFVPKDIYLPVEVENMEMISDWLNHIRGRSLEIHIPKLGDKKKLVEMANVNAGYLVREFILSIDKRDQVIPRSVLALQRDLRLKNPPRHIECFDNSHLQGTELVSSMVYFEDGKPLKSNYKKFKAIDVHQNDDFATMKETVFRRYKRLKDENGKLPDLIVIDGGKGQLSAAMESINELGIADKIVVIGLAKRLEEIFFPNESESILLPRTSSSLRLLQQVRDEAHRFAITFHRKLRDKRTLSTELTKIEGVGIKTAMKLLEKFGSVNEIKNKTDDELLEIVNIKIIKKIRDYFDLKV